MSITTRTCSLVDILEQTSSKQNNPAWVSGLFVFLLQVITPTSFPMLRLLVQTRSKITASTHISRPVAQTPRSSRLFLLICALSPEQWNQFSPPHNRNPAPSICTRPLKIPINGTHPRVQQRRAKMRTWHSLDPAHAAEDRSGYYQSRAPITQTCCKLNSSSQPPVADSEMAASLYRTWP